MQNKILFTARVLAGKNADAVEKLVKHFAGPDPQPLRGVMGVNTGKGTPRTAWRMDLGAGIAKFERLMAAFEGNTQQATAAYVTSEAKVRGAGRDWPSLLPEGLR